MSSTVQKSIEHNSDFIDLTKPEPEKADILPTSTSDASAVQKQKTSAEVYAEELKILDQLHEEVALYNYSSNLATSSSNTAIIGPRVLTKSSEIGVASYSPSKLSSSSSSTSSVDSMTSDQRSVYVGGVEYSTTAIQLKQLFKGCGDIQRANIITNRHDGTSKGFAYIEFASMESVESALALNGTYLNGRMITVLKKRTNLPGLCSTNRAPRGFRARQATYSSRGHGTRGYSERLSRGVGDHRYKIVRNSQGQRCRGSFYSPY